MISVKPYMTWTQRLCKTLCDVPYKNYIMDISNSSITIKYYAVSDDVVKYSYIIRR